MVPVAAKAGALLAVAAAGSTSVWYFSDSIFGSPLVSIAEDQESSYPDNSIGKNYSKYFLSSKSNENIWQERFDKNQDKLTGKTKYKDKFGTVTLAYHAETATALNKVCDSLYQLAATSDLVNTEPTDTNGTDKYTTEYIWKFCGLRDIVTLDKDTPHYPPSTFTSDKIGGEAINKKLFVSTKVDGNDWFWNLKTKEFWSGQAKIEGTEQDKNVFKKLKEEGEKNTNIKETCEAAYNKTTAEDSGKKNKEDALTFCSIRLQLTSVSS